MSLVIASCSEGVARSARALREQTFRAAKDQIACARQFTQDALADHPAVDVAVLLVSELTTNSVLHSRSSDFTLEITRTEDDDLHVIVFDSGRGGLPQLLDGGPADEGGRGVRLIDGLATRWGVMREREAGMAVWFDLLTSGNG
jgi:anti-sigma regulatory factor (Ser/Thr protein kinase)